MREPIEWEEEDILGLIADGVQESLTLDYKRCASLDRRNPSRRTELSKDVSSFANSAGGVIVYGVIEDQHLPTAIDLGYDPLDITREWLEQVINATIQRRISGIRIKQIELKATNPGKVIYVVVIPQSKRAPHMAEDHIFYKRYNYQSIPMEEYEVRDVAQRMDSPDLKLQYVLVNRMATLEFEADQEWSKPIEFNVTITNESPAPAMYYVAQLYIDKRIKIVDPSQFKHESELGLKIGDIEADVSLFSRNFGVPGKMPIWQGIAFRICDSPLKIALPKDSTTQDFVLGWSVHSPGMQQRLGIAILEVRASQVSLRKFNEA
jgi:hypothetical protein